MREYFRLIPYLKPLWLKIIIGLMLIITGSVFEGASITMLYPVIDKVFVVSASTEESPSRGVGAVFKAVSGSLTAVISEGWQRFGTDNWLGQIKHFANQHWQELMRQFSRKDVLLFLCLFFYKAHL